MLVALIPVGLAAPRVLSLIVAAFSGIGIFLGQFLADAVYPVAYFNYLHGGAMLAVALLFTFVISGMREGMLFRSLVNQRDMLTGFFNYRRFMKEMTRAIADSLAGGHNLCVGYIDCENLKYINDLNGHSAGDNALRMVGTCISENLRHQDVPGRMSGDEFIFFMPKIDYEEADTTLKCIRNDIDREIGDAGIPLSFNMGACTFESPPLSIPTIMKRVLDSVYYSRTQGKKTLVHIKVEGGEAEK